MDSMLISFFVILLIAYVGLGTILYFMQPTFLYCPMREVSYTPEELDLDFEDVVFKTDDGLRLNGWYIPAPLEARRQKSLTGSVPSEGSLLTGPAVNSQFTVLFCHGNGGNIMHRLDSINFFHNLGLSCFVFDYRGYGNSEGRTTEEGTYLDVMAAYSWLIRGKKISPDDIVIFGRSLGGSIAAHLAAKVEAGSLVIESAFTSYADIGKKFYPYMPVRWFARFSYRTIDYVKAVRCPVMVIHSRNDDVVPFEFGLELYKEANEPKEFIEIFGSHNDGFLVSSEIYTKAWMKWLRFLREAQSNAERHRAS
jgi:fermentation-respiration switch protein FrsA (DUF1100 family)